MVVDFVVVKVVVVVVVVGSFRSRSRSRWDPEERSQDLKRTQGLQQLGSP